jgi:hypothetical protein
LRTTLSSTQFKEGGQPIKIACRHDRSAQHRSNDARRGDGE